MVRNVIIAILILLVMVGGIFLFTKVINPANQSGKQLELAYKASAGIPYKWEYEIGNEDIVKFVKSYVAEDNNKDGMVGASVTTNYVFEGLKEGTTTITFKFVNFTDGTVDQEETHNVKVDKDKNISLIEN